MDFPHVSAKEIFEELTEVNKKSVAQLSSYVLAKMWNNSPAVKCGAIRGKTANDFIV